MKSQYPLLYTLLYFLLIYAEEEEVFLYPEDRSVCVCVLQVP